MDDNKNEIRKENIEQNKWTPENKIAMTKCIVAGACAFALITDPVYDVIIDNDHGHFQAMISANN